MYTSLNIVETLANLRQSTDQFQLEKVDQIKNKNRIKFLSTLVNLSYPGTYNIPAGSTDGAKNIALAALQHIKKLKKIKKCKKCDN